MKSIGRLKEECDDLINTWRFCGHIGIVPMCLHLTNGSEVIRVIATMRRNDFDYNGGKAMLTAEAEIIKTKIHRPLKKRRFIRTVNRQKSLIIMSIPILVYVFIFSYRPLKGLVMAFQNYRPGKTVQQWVGMKQFAVLFKDEAFLSILRNTICMSALNLIVGFISAILLAILINEIKNAYYKKIVQSVSYLPHFLSWVIVTGMVANFLSSDSGLINNMLMQTGILENPIHWLAEPGLFWWIVAAAHVWKETGWNSIIYLAAIMAISPDLYEAAYIDGANRFQRIRYITLPGIKSTFIILLIMNLGWILNAGFEVQFLLDNGMIRHVSQTIDIFVIRRGIALGNFSLGTAAGLFKSVVSLVMLTVANYTAGKLSDERLV